MFSARKYEHVTPLLRDLHWLLVPQRVEYKLAMLVYRCLHGLAPLYLADDLQLVADFESRQRLRSLSSDTLVVPPTSLHSRRPSCSGFSCLRLERTAGTRHIVAVATHIQTPFEDISFLSKFSLRCFAIDITITTASPYTSNIVVFLFMCSVA